MLTIIIGAVPVPRHLNPESLASIFPVPNDPALSFRRGVEVAGEQIELGKVNQTTVIYFDQRTGDYPLLAGVLTACARYNVVPKVFAFDGEYYLLQS